uniref:uncharacterized protein LOC120343330 isoform X2 n=1 Tax=Styela clava TaxID=7725 RepID=UPI001939BCD8|nr:uncharacterized protein LOC120343330 isoform X2 [Styela clava]
MKSRYSVFVIIVFLSFAWSREIYSGNDIDIERIQGVWFLTFGVDYWSWNVLWKCHIIAPFNVTDNRMNLGTYNFFKNKSKAPLSVIDEVKRDSQGQFWMKGPNEKIWENLDTKLFGNKRKPISNMEHPSQDRKLFQIYTRNPTINDGDISEFTTLAVEQGVDPTTLTTFGCGDLNPSEFMSA